MRRTAAALALVALAGCAPRDLALPEDRQSQASVCGAVRALELRRGGGAATMSFDGFTEILHFAMIYAAEESAQVDLRRLLTVSRRAPVVMEELADKEWASLVEPCNTAFPETQRNAPALPRDSYEAGMTCFALADFISKTAGEYPDDQRAAAALTGPALAAAQPVLRQRASDNEDAHRIAAGYAARAFRAGRPSSLLDQCRRRFPAAG